MLDRLRACVIASYYGRVMHSAQAVSCVTSCFDVLLEMSVNCSVIDCWLCYFIMVTVSFGCLLFLCPVLTVVRLGMRDF